MEVGQIKQRRLSDNIVEQLETMILEGTLQPGQRLPAERALAEQFGVSRPSLREAVQKLVAKGLLISRQGGGNYVSDTLGSSFSDPLLALLLPPAQDIKSMDNGREAVAGDGGQQPRAAASIRAAARRGSTRGLPSQRAALWFQRPRPRCLTGNARSAVR